MRRVAVLLALLLLTSTAFAQSQRRSQAAPHAQPGAATPNAPPHAWLFGVWTGGLFPVLDGMAAQDCKTQPTVQFGRDSVGHASLVGSEVIQRVIETVRATPMGAEFRFSPVSGGAAAGFGCEDPNILHVAREAGTIAFPHCAAFPYPLHRCPAA